MSDQKPSRAANESLKVSPIVNGQHPGESPQNTDFLGPSLPSWPARIGRSARNLTRDALGNGASSTTNSLATSLAATEKAGPSATAANASASAWAEAGPSRSTWGGRYTSSSQNDLRSGFRADSQSDDHTSYDSGTFDFDESTQQDSSSFTTSRIEAEDLTYQQQQRLSRQYFHDDALTAKYPQTDGAEVIALLSQPNSMLNAASLQHDIAIEQQDAESTVADLFGEEKLTQDEREAHRQIRETVSNRAPPTPQATLRYDHTRFAKALPVDSTVPSVSRPLSSHSAKATRQLYPNTEVLHLPLQTDPAARRLSITSDSSITFFSSHKEREDWYSQWVEQWDDVLNNYQQAVWGATEIPRLEEARSQIEEVKSREQQGEEWWNDTAAVRRLRQVLGHLGSEAAPVDQNAPAVTQQDFEAVWSRAHRNGKRKAQPQDTDEPQFRCPDCEGIYGTDEHLLRHDQWAASNGHVKSRTEAELRHQSETMGRYTHVKHRRSISSPATSES